MDASVCRCGGGDGRRVPLGDERSCNESDLNGAEPRRARLLLPSWRGVRVLRAHRHLLRQHGEPDVHMLSRHLVAFPLAWGPPCRETRPARSWELARYLRGRPREKVFDICAKSSGDLSEPSQCRGLAAGHHAPEVRPADARPVGKVRNRESRRFRQPPNVPDEAPVECIGPRLRHGVDGSDRLP
jgi:hypothetical protein